MDVTIPTHFAQVPCFSATDRPARAKGSRACWDSLPIAINSVRRRSEQLTNARLRRQRVEPVCNTARC